MLSLYEIELVLGFNPIYCVCIYIWGPQGYIWLWSEGLLDPGLVSNSSVVLKEPFVWPGFEPRSITHMVKHFNHILSFI